MNSAFLQHGCCDWIATLPTNRSLTAVAVVVLCAVPSAPACADEPRGAGGGARSGELISEGERIVAGHTALFTEPPRRVPTQGMPNGPLLGNGDVGVVVGGPAEAQRFHIGKTDFWRRNNASAMVLGVVHLAFPGLEGATYRQEQDMALGEVRGTFVKDGRQVALRSWVDAHENLLVTEAALSSGPALPVHIALTSGPALDVPGRIIATGQPLNIGCERYVPEGRFFFHGVIDDVRVYDRALEPADIARLATYREPVEQPAFSWPADPPPGTQVFNGVATPGNVGPTVRFNGRYTHVEAPAPPVRAAVTIAVWLQIESASHSANYILSVGPWNHGYSLGLSRGRLRWTIGKETGGGRVVDRTTWSAWGDADRVWLDSEELLPLREWVHVAATFDGDPAQRRMRIYVNGVLKASSGETVPGVDESSATCAFTRRADPWPGSREVAVVTRVLGANAAPDGESGLEAQLEPGKPLVVTTVIRSDLDVNGPPLVAAQARARELSPALLDSMRASHRAWWSQFWSRSFVEIPDKEIEKRWYGAQYIMASCSRAGEVPPGLWGNWITTDEPLWHGDFHLNYDYQAPYYIVYSSNHPELALPMYQPLLDAIPTGREIARKRGWTGIHLPVSIGPWGLLPEGPNTDWGQRSNAAFAALNFIWHYQHTQDETFLRDTAYPFLSEVAAFWEDYLKLEDGRYVIRGDTMHEEYGAPEPNLNPLFSLGLVRTLFTNMLEMSAVLGRDGDRRAKWSGIIPRISDFPLQQRDGKTVFRYNERGMGWCDGGTLGVHHIYPAGAIGLGSDPKLLEISRNTIEAMAPTRWHDEKNGLPNWYTVCARVGYDPETILARLRTETDNRSYPNLLVNYDDEGGGGIENVSGYLAVNEMLLQSHEGVLRLFPCWPRERPARFVTLRAVGAFLVSAELVNGTIRGVEIYSEKGRPCTVQNPWPGRSVQLIRNRANAEALTGDRLTFATSANETIELRPQ